MIAPHAAHITVDGERRLAPAFPSLKLTIAETASHSGTVHTFELRLTNKGERPVAVGSVELPIRHLVCPGGDAASCRFYREGLTAVGVAGSRGVGDCDFELDPDFLRFTVSNPGAYRWDRPGRICAEHVGVLCNAHTGENLLAGFVTANRYCCRIIMAAGPREAVALHAVVDTERMPLDPGACIALEKLMLARGDDAESLLRLYAEELGAAMQAAPPAVMPSGWCSYYYYYGSETEDDILENARFLAEHRASIPVEVIQVDDGWQAARGNWMDSSPAKFPHGMAWLAREISALGFKPGIWVAPFLVAPDTPVHQEHGEWLLRARDGDLLEMGGCRLLDPSHPDALRWLARVFRALRDWGYTYFKLDFMMVAVCHGAQYHDRTLTRLEAYRKGLRAIRKAVGPEAFLLGGTSLLGPNVGLVDGCRVSTDVTPFWCKEDHTPESPAIFNVCRNIINRGYMHKRLWINDPDCLIVRETHDRAKYGTIPSLTLAEVHMLASAMILSGGSIFLGDRLGMLPPPRLAIIRKVLALANGVAAQPLDRMDREIPRVWFRQGRGTTDDPHLLGVFNWSRRRETTAVPIARLGLGSVEHYTIADVWQDDGPVEVLTNGDTLLLPHTCKLISIVSVHKQATR